MTAVTITHRRGRLVMTPRRSNVLGTSFCDRGFPFMLLLSMRLANVCALQLQSRINSSPSFERGTSRHPVDLTGWGSARFRDRHLASPSCFMDFASVAPGVVACRHLCG